MKKLILSVTAVAAMSVPAFAQGIFFQDNGTAAYDTTIAGAPNQNDLNLALLQGSTVLTTLLLSDGTATGDITGNGGLIYDNSGDEFLTPTIAGTTAPFTVEAWTGDYSSYAAALASGVTGVFAGSDSFTVAIAAPASPPPNGNDISNFGVVNLTQVPTTAVPEPSTLAMAGVGLASMLLFRRKNS
jgi:hypothetical protein